MNAKLTLYVTLVAITGYATTTTGAVKGTWYTVQVKGKPRDVWEGTAYVGGRLFDYQRLGIQGMLPGRATMTVEAEPGNKLTVTPTGHCSTLGNQLIKPTGTAQTINNAENIVEISQPLNGAHNGVWGPEPTWYSMWSCQFTIKVEGTSPKVRLKTGRYYTNSGKGPYVQYVSGHLGKQPGIAGATSSVGEETTKNTNNNYKYGQWGTLPYDSHTTVSNAVNTTISYVPFVELGPPPYNQEEFLQVGGTGAVLATWRSEDPTRHKYEIVSLDERRKWEEGIETTLEAPEWYRLRLKNWDGGVFGTWEDHITIEYAPK